MKKKEVVFATHNRHKLEEVQTLVGEGIFLKSLTDLNYDKEIPEDHDTLEANALQKAMEIFRFSQIPCFADDTGLEVEALNGAPGVYSARFAGPERSSEKNTTRLLKELEGVENRKARFRTVIAFCEEGDEQLFEGIVDGTITRSPSGEKGFGYDPVFKPDGYTKTFAEMNMEEKNMISHRARAFQKLTAFLQSKI